MSVENLDADRTRGDAGIPAEGLASSAAPYEPDLAPRTMRRVSGSDS